MKNKKRNNNLLKNIFIIFLMIQPILDTIFFYNHLTTLVRVVFIGVYLILTVILIKESRKNFKYLLLYYFIIIVYLFLTYYRSENFISLLPKEYGYNVMEELLTMVKLSMPITIIYILKYLKLNKKDYFKIVNSWVLLVAGSIILFNITGLSLSSYSDDIIKYNIFHWNNKIDYRLTASRGFFVYANQEAVIMLILLLLSIYETIYMKRRAIIYVITLCIAMLMLGTRVSSIGGLLTLILAFIIYFILIVINKERINKRVFWLLIPMIIWPLLLLYSPSRNRYYELNYDDSHTTIKYDNPSYTPPVTKEDIKDIEDKRIKYVYENYDRNYLPDFFFENYYPIKYDPDFWYNFVKTHDIHDINYRIIETEIIKRMISVNDNKYDKFFGIGNSTVQHVVNIEKDFLLHYYTYGIIGSAILLLAYIVMPIKAIIEFIREKSYFKFIISSCIILFMAVAFLTGNIINSMTTIMAFSLVSSGLNLNKEE